MDTPLKQVLKDIGKEYELDDEIIDPVIKKLNAEFFFKLKDMKNATEAVWKSLGLPLNLYFRLNELYQAASQQTAPKPQPQCEPVKQMIPTYAPPKQEVSTIKREPSKQIKGDVDVQNHLGLICSEINNLDITREVFRIIHSVITNICKNPNEEKFRKINIEKIMTKYNYKSILNFFLSIHFKQVDQYLYLTIPSADLNTILPELNSFIKANKLAESNFNPYQSSFASLNNDDKKLQKIASNEANFEELLLKEKQRRNKIIKEAKITRNPKAYKISEGYGLNQIIQAMNEKDDNLMNNSEDDKLIYKTSMELIKQNANNRFTLKSRSLFEAFIKTPVYIKSDIRLKFPDSTILEGSFALYEKVGDIYDFVRGYLKNPSCSFNISTTPPLKRYTKLDDTIFSLKLYPQILMYVNFDNTYEGLKEEEIEKIKIEMDLGPNNATTTIITGTIVGTSHKEEDKKMI